jgi:methylenetetrahydrofolate dehydrogenase (NADP+)/methenyltetrahydrofolate cyclohydrolase
MNELIDGTALARTVRAQLATRVAGLPRRPGLAVVVVGDNPASAVYVRNKIRACDEVGILSERVALPADVTEAELLAQIDRLNARADIDGILVQLPLPAHLPVQSTIDRVAATKDVDGLHTHNLGALLTGLPAIVPCTPAAVLALLDSVGCELRGREVVVVGASNVVGKPAALLLLQRGATVTLCNSKTRDLASATRRADVVVAAVGRPGLITGDMVKPGAVVIDVGINRLPDGRLAGDVDTASVRPVASHITPVPGGVGPMTVAMLVSNTVASAERTLGIDRPTGAGAASA